MAVYAPKTYRQWLTFCCSDRTPMKKLSSKYSQKLFPTQIQSNPNRPMKNHVKPYFLLGAALLGLAAGTMQAQILGVDCGAVSTNAGAKLKFINGANYSSTGSFVAPLTYQ